MTMIHDTKTLESLLKGTSATLHHDGTLYDITLESKPSCSQNCPAGINVKGYVNLIANRKYEEALHLIRESNPFPGICGRVCTHPCESNCERSEDGNALSIKALKRFVSDYEVSRKPQEFATAPPAFEEKIAIIGSGPAGLTAAVDLTRLGYEVTVFEEMAIPGGMMMWGIPEFRLPRSVLHREIEFIRSMGVTIETGTRVANPLSLLGSDYSAVVMATGSWKGLKLRIPREDLTGVHDGLAFLRKVYEHEITEITGHAVIIGGGDSAIDAARTALRMGAEKVTIAYRRTRDEMPANDAEIREALEEGIKLKTLVIPMSVEGDDHVEGLRLIRAELGEEDDSGRRRPIPVEGSEFVLSCDLIIPTIGALAGADDLTAAGVPFTAWNTIEAAPIGGATAVPGLFAIGDAVRGPSTIVDVIGDAHSCAASIHSYLRDEGVPPGVETKTVRRGAVIRPPEFRPGERHSIPIMDADARGQCFDEVEECYSELIARTEASRCNTCGPCFECPTCLPGCDSKQVVAKFENTAFLLKVPTDLSRTVYDRQYGPNHGDGQGEEEFELIREGTTTEPVTIHSLTPFVQQELCFACGRCESACAYRAIRVGLKRGGKAYSYIDHDICRSCGRCVLVCPSGAITLEQYADPRIDAAIDWSMKENSGIAVFSCHWSRKDDAIATVELMCSIGITPAIIIQAFALGARGVLVSHCPASGDHYLPIEYDTNTIVDATKGVFIAAGIEPTRIRTATTKDLRTEIDHFANKLDEHTLSPLTSLESDNTPGRIGRAFGQLQQLACAAEGSPCVNHTLLKGTLLQASGMPHCVDMIENLGKVLEILGIQMDPKTIPDHVLSPSVIPSSEEKIMPELILEKLKGLDLATLPFTIGIHASCAANDVIFATTIEKLINEIPGATAIRLDQKGCGGNDWRYLDSYAREKAMSVYRTAEENNVDIIVPTSVDCLTHLQACNRTGSWRHSSLEVMDIYSLFHDAISGGDGHD